MAYGAARGFRNLAVAAIFIGSAAGANAEPVTLAALGDSLTQGYGLPPEDGLVPQLQEWLTAQGADVTVVNAGVSGDTTAGGTVADRLDADAGGGCDDGGAGGQRYAAGNRPGGQQAQIWRDT